MYELVATHQFSKLLPNHMYELVAPHQFSKLLPNHMYELVATHQFSNLLPNHIHALVRNPLVQQTTAKPYASFSARPTSLANYCQTICMRQCRTHQFSKLLPNHMYELVATHQFSKLLPNHIHALVRDPLVFQTTFNRKVDI